MLLKKLQAMNTDAMLAIEELMELSAYARGLENEYEQMEQPVPEWLITATDTLRTEIGNRTRAADMAALKNLQAELEGYKSVNEKRNEATKRLADLQRKLGLGTAAAGSRKS